MKKTLLNVAVVLPMLVAAFFFGVRYGHVKQQSSDQRRELRSTLAVSPSERAPGMTYVMQWNDKAKKLVFDGQPISHKTIALRTICGSSDCGLTYAVPLLHDEPDEYSFHVLPCLGSDEERDSTGISSGHGQLQYLVEWNDQTGRFILHDQPIKFPKEFCLSIASSSHYPSPWEATLPGCNTIENLKFQISNR